MTPLTEELLAIQADLELLIVNTNDPKILLRSYCSEFVKSDSQIMILHDYEKADVYWVVSEDQILKRCSFTLKTMSTDA